jgi:O-antigen/teichoic acid export membrane protein
VRALTRARQLRENNPLPEGTVAVGVGLAVTGAASYAFLGVAGHALGPTAVGGLSVLWVLVYLVGPGFFLPLEQEVSRVLATRITRGIGTGPIVRRAAMLGGALAAGLLVVTLIFSPVITDRFFGGDWLLLVGLMIGIVGYFAANLVEGTLSGNGHFVRYGVYLGGEALIRLGICVACAVVGFTTAGPYGLALGLAPLLALAPALWRAHGLETPGPEVPWKELSVALGSLLTASVLAQVLINAGPLLVQLLAGPGDEAAVGIFTAAVVVARVPLFVFQAVQAALLPKLSAQAAAGEFDEFRDGFRRLLIIIGGIVFTGTVVAFAVGPWIVRLMFGPGFVVSRQTVGLLALGSGTYIMAITLAQATIALGRSRHVAVGWGLGVASMLAVVAVGHDLMLRVGLGYLAGSAVAALVMAVSLRRAVRHGATLHLGDVIEALHDLPLEP